MPRGHRCPCPCLSVVQPQPYNHEQRRLSIREHGETYMLGLEVSGARGERLPRTVETDKAPQNDPRRAWSTR
jgi:hypothetical protein